MAKKQDKKGKVYTVRALKENESALLKSAYKEYQNLFYFPLNRRLIEDIFTFGGFWIIENESENYIFCLFPSAVPSFRQSGAFWEIEDLIGDDFKNYLVMGYIGGEKPFKNPEILSAAINGVKLASGAKFNKIIFYTPVQTGIDFKTLFDNGFVLKGVRGLDNLVPHYIFGTNLRYDKPRQKAVAFATDIKEISRLCEKGFEGFCFDGRKLCFGKGKDDE